MNKTHTGFFLSLLAASILVACGGGGGGSSTPTTPTAPAVPTLDPAAYDIRQLVFTWADVAGVTFYRLLENPDGASGYTQIGSDIPYSAVTASSYRHDISVHFQDWSNASYILQACNTVGCTDSAAIFATSDEQAIGYFKASNAGNSDQFGWSVALSGDGSTFAVGANLEDSRTLGINTVPNDDGSADDSGAVYIFTGGAGTWNEQAYIKPSDTTAGDEFGHKVALSQDGNLLAVTAHNRNANAGAVYIFSRSAGVWTQQTIVTPALIAAADQFGSDVALSADGTVLAVGASGDDGSGSAYVFVQGANPTVWTEKPVIKGANTGAGDAFGWSVSISDDASTLAVGAIAEDGSNTGIDPADNDVASSAGAVYVFTTADGWTSVDQEHYIKASAVAVNDYFGRSVSLSQDGNVLAVGADGDETGGTDAGMAYVFSRDGVGVWTQHSQLAASNAGVDDAFGFRVSVNNAGDVLAIGAAHNAALANTGNGEDSAATGIDGDEANNGAVNSGAVYVFTLNANVWTQDAYVKASNTAANAEFGAALSLDDTGEVMTVGAFAEGAPGSGAAYLY